MNIFESLVEELKEDNLLETTVVETSEAASEANSFAADEIIEAETFLENYEQDFQENELQVAAEARLQDEAAARAEKFQVELTDNAEIIEEEVTRAENLPEHKSRLPQMPVNQADFYRQRATEEVFGLQTVEHIISGIEREQMRIVVKPYNDLEVKKSLHRFLQIVQDDKSPEHSQAEFQLMQETETWHSALSHRDKNISVAHLRRFCETTRPVLSSQALLSLARFYRNSPFSESIRSKFDLVITRIFARDIGDDRREAVFARDELVKHLTKLFAGWSGESVYANEEGESDSLLTAFKFEDFMAEADASEDFNELVRKDFFNRLQVFKESTREQFFSPLITASVIESNIRIGNRYVELLQKEREKGEAERIENTYGFLHDQVISDATSKTLQLVELLKENKVAPKLEQPAQIKPPVIGKTARNSEKTKTTPKPEIAPRPIKLNKDSLAAINNLPSRSKWLLGAALIAVVLLLGFYFSSGSQSAADSVSSANVKKVNLENSSLKNYVKDARIGNNVFYGTVLPGWTTLSREKKEEILKKISSIGNDKGFKSVNLQDEQKKVVGSATADKVEVF